jgi:hypothetical protein
MPQLQHRPDAALSDFDLMRWHRLPNWGRWGRDDPDKPDPNKCGRSICADYIPRGDDGEGWGEEGAIGAKPPPVDFRDAENLDGFIQQLDAERRQHIRRFFYLRQPVRWELLDEAIRGLLDALDANRRTIREMEDRLHGRRSR